MEASGAQWASRVKLRKQDKKGAYFLSGFAVLHADPYVNLCLKFMPRNIRSETYA